MKCGREQATYAVLFAAVFSGLTGAWASVALAEPMKVDVRAVVNGNNEFALDLYARLRTEPGNLFMSPYSISTGLAMTYGGARGETARQMGETLHFSVEQERLHPAFAGLLASDSAASGDPGCEFHLANALWGQKEYGFLAEFLALTGEHYGAGLRQVGFAEDPEQARQTINTWVEDRTRQKIKELLQGSDLTAETVLVLTNAIYFKGDWASRFDKERTQDASFRINEKEQVVVPMMHQVGRFAFVAADNLDLLELPYKGDRRSMVLLLPKKIGGLPGLEDSLSMANLDRWLGQLSEQPVRVSLPRFKLGSRFDLTRTLAAMGMPDAFSGGNADFSGITGRRDLLIDKVIHQAKVEVNEAGTEAAAGTAVVLKKGPPIATFLADHPFLFLIRDRHSGSILFIGRVANPTE